MKKIWKYNLGLPGSSVIRINIPKWAELLTVDVQHESIVLWAKVETQVASVSRNFVIYATGGPFLAEDYMKDAKFVGTVFYDALVWHVYDLGEVG